MANSKYNSYGNGSGSTSGSSDSGGDYEPDTVLKWKPHATFRAVLDSLHSADNHWGQSLGIKFTDGKLVDGVLMERISNGEPDGTIKLFPWESMPVVLGDDLSADDAPEVFTEEFGGKTYRYQLVGARVEEGEDEAADPEEPIEIGDFIMWESGGQSPSASAKIFAQMFTAAGRDVIVDREDINNWLDTNNVNLRADLIGREVDVFKVTREGDEYEYHSPVVIDTKTGSQVMMDNAVDGDSPAAEAAQTDGGATPVPEQSNESEEVDVGAFPDPVADFVEFCRDFSLDDEEQILTNLREMAEEDENSLSPEMVEAVGEDEIVVAILE